jgi:cell division protein FtsB
MNKAELKAENARLREELAQATGDPLWVIDQEIAALERKLSALHAKRNRVFREMCLDDG